MTKKEKLKAARLLRRLFIKHKDLFSAGFCGFILRLGWRDIISDSNRRFLDKFIYGESVHFNDLFFFPAGNYSKRLNWLNKTIERLK